MKEQSLAQTLFEVDKDIRKTAAERIRYEWLKLRSVGYSLSDLLEKKQEVLTKWTTYYLG